MVDPGGLEPPTSALQMRRSTAELRALEYCPALHAKTEERAEDAREDVLEDAGHVED